MTSEIVMALVGLFCTTVSGVVTFLLTKRKYNTEVDSQYIQNVREAFDTYKQTMKDTFESQNRKIDMLQKENDTLREQVNQLQVQVFNLVKNLYGGSIPSGKGLSFKENTSEVETEKE